MLHDQKAKALAALKRLQGLNTKVVQQLEDGEYCIDVLRNVLAMKGHLEHVQSQILESHLHTCAPKKLASDSKDAFVQELLQVIGHSSR